MSLRPFTRAILGLAILAGAVAGCNDSTDVDDDSPATITISSGDGQTGTVNTALANPIVVKVEDVDGDDVAGATVTWAVASGDGTLSAVTGTTGSDGTAQVTWTLGPTAGTNTATATVSGLTPVTFTATGQ
jgi:hypothetical protein